MRRKLALILTALLLGSGTCGYSDAPDSGWQWQREIKTDAAARFNRVEIPPEVYAQAQMGLGDLRILDDTGKAVPYILETPQEITQDLAPMTEFTLLRSFQKGNEVAFDFAGAVPEGTDLLINRMTAIIGFDDDFFKYVELYGSYDNRRWEWIGADTLYRVAGTVDDTLVLDTARKYGFYRIVILDNVEGIALQGLAGTLVTSAEKLSVRTIALPSAALSRVENASLTEIRVKGYRNLPVHAIALDAEGLYHRPSQVRSDAADTPYTLFGSGYLYQSTLKGDKPLKNSLALRATEPYDTLLLQIENNDSPPLTIDGITLEYAADALIFETAPGSAYRLQYGNATAPTPQYDLDTFRNEIIQQQLGTAVLSAETPVDASKSKPSAFPIDQKTLFSAVIFCVGLLLAWLAIRGMRK